MAQITNSSLIGQQFALHNTTPPSIYNRGVQDALSNMKSHDVSILNSNPTRTTAASLDLPLRSDSVALIYQLSL